MIITIDGPAGSGKSTAARNLAKRLDVAFLDTGATYRAATLRALREGVDLTDKAALARCARDATIQLDSDGVELRVLLDGQDVSREIRTSRVTDNVRHLAKSPEVREVLVELQRRIGGQLGSFVTEGRDQGSVVFPDADVKFFLQADPAVRARRRVIDLRDAGEEVSFEAVLDAIEQRDRDDRNRPVGPLTEPEGAIQIDTTDLSPEQTVDALEQHVKEARS